MLICFCFWPSLLSEVSLFCYILCVVCEVFSFFLFQCRNMFFFLCVFFFPFLCSAGICCIRLVTHSCEAAWHFESIPFHHHHHTSSGSTWTPGSFPAQIAMEHNAQNAKPNQPLDAIHAMINRLYRHRRGCFSGYQFLFSRYKSRPAIAMTWGKTKQGKINKRHASPSTPVCR